MENPIQNPNPAPPEYSEQTPPSAEGKPRFRPSKRLLILLVALLIIPLGLAGAYMANQNKEIKEVACTMEAKICPDGSSVGRTGPNCEFSKCPDVTPTLSPSPIDETAQSFLEIPEYGVKFALTEAIKDAYYLPSTADKGYVYLKVRSLDSEPQCAEDESSTAALSKVGKDDINEMSGMKYSDAGNGVTIGNYYYYIDLAQYECAESVDGKATLVKVRKAFTDASGTITKL